MTPRNTTMVSARLDREISHRQAEELARRMHGAELIAIAVRGDLLGVANRTRFTPYPALEIAGEAFADGLAEAGYQIRSWRSVEWLCGAETPFHHHTPDLVWRPLAA
ncbi:hypothetical protein [Amycolatopsis albispora]|uniref:Uncharacterized protein n=1 Tax=Amycolatopsis albispora TaxID=1804986 RepID=A0A344L6P1_9PSEU|nr:hypothetical protein [Amycolatopsis albispora]AXB43715.1 hypothetical protein A4R43_15240 [Amycolatopsis albispora]